MAISTQAQAKLVDDLVAIEAANRKAKDGLNEAKASVDEAGDTSIAGIVRKITAVNGTIDEDEATDIADGFAQKAYGDSTPGAQRTAKSKMKTLLMGKPVLTQALGDLSKFAKANPDLRIHLREKVIQIAGWHRKDPTTPVGDLLTRMKRELGAAATKKKLTPLDRATAALAKLRENDTFRKKTGDVSILDIDAARLIAQLEDLAQGHRPTPIEETPEFQRALDRELDKLRQEGVAFRLPDDAEHLSEHFDATDTALEASGGASDGDENPEGGDTSEGDEADPEPAETQAKAPKTRRPRQPDPELDDDGTIGLGVTDLWNLTQPEKK